MASAPSTASSRSPTGPGVEGPVDVPAPRGEPRRAPPAATSSTPTHPRCFRTPGPGPAPLILEAPDAGGGVTTRSRSRDVRGHRAGTGRTRSSPPPARSSGTTGAELDQVPRPRLRLAGSSSSRGRGRQGLGATPGLALPPHPCPCVWWASSPARGCSQASRLPLPSTRPAPKFRAPALVARVPERVLRHRGRHEGPSLVHLWSTRSQRALDDIEMSSLVVPSEPPDPACEGPAPSDTLYRCRVALPRLPSPPSS